MTLKQVLDELESLKICDEQTVEILSTGDNFIETTATTLLDVYKNLPQPLEIVPSMIRNFSIREEIRKEKKTAIGIKLLFLEDLVIHDSRSQDQVKSWLEDPKRKFLFIESDYGNVYGELLLAKAEGRLDEYRRDFNPNARKQSLFEFKKSLRVTSDPNLDFISDRRKLIEEKLDKVLEKMDSLFKWHVYSEEEEKYLDPDYVIKEVRNDPEALDDGKTRTCALPEHIISFYENLYNLGYIGKEDHELITKNDVIQYNKYEDDKYEEIELRSGIESSREAVLNTKTEFYNIADSLKNRIKISILSEHKFETDEDYSGFRYTEEYRDLNNLIKKNEEHESYENEINELSSLNRENIRLNIEMGESERLSSKYKNLRHLTYSMELSDKDPLDVRFGNDSGCCIGVYENSDEGIENAYGLPNQIADNATYIFNINQQVETNKKRRVGIVLGFETLDDFGNIVLACNSIELSPAMNPISCIKDIVSFTEEGLVDFARENDYDALMMSSNVYNTSYNYSGSKENRPKRKETLKKVSPPIERPFHSEILSEFTEVNVRLDNFYVLYDERRDSMIKSDRRPISLF